MVNRWIGMVICGVALAAHAQISWTQLPDFPGTPRDDAASFTIGTDVYVGTGMEVGWGLTTDWWRFDGIMNQWSQVASLPGVARQYCTTFVIGSKGYLFGGLGTAGELNELWEYDPDTDQWTQLPALPSTPRYACIGWGYDEKGFIATGMLEGGSPTSEFWTYDRTAGIWSQLDDVPGPPRHRAASFGAGVVAGGADSTGQALSDVWAFPAGMGGAQWTSLDDLPAARFGADGVDMFSIVIGGATDFSDFHDDVWFDDSSLSWQIFPSFPGGPRKGGVSGSFCCLGAWAYYGTGLDESMTRHNDWWALNLPSAIEEVGIDGLTLAPNPGTAYFTFVGLPPGPFDLTVSDAQGRVVIDSDDLIQRTMDASGWNNGLYIITATDPTGRIYRARWIKL